MTEPTNQIQHWTLRQLFPRSYILSQVRFIGIISNRFPFLYIEKHLFITKGLAPDCLTSLFMFDTTSNVWGKFMLVSYLQATLMHWVLNSDPKNSCHLVDDFPSDLVEILSYVGSQLHLYSPRNIISHEIVNVFLMMDGGQMLNPLFERAFLHTH